MSHQLSRRAVLSGSIAALPSLAASVPKSVLIDTHIHLFSEDRKRFPYHPRASYRPEVPQPLAAYIQFVKQAKIDHAIIVHPEPYQDDHRYLEYCFENEPSPGFFKGTCLFDPILPDTPARMEGLVKRLPRRIVALRIHENQDPKKPPTTSGPIRDRDMRSPAMRETWRKAHSLGLAIQMHFIPFYATRISDLAKQFPGMPVILDHIGRYAEGTAEEYEEVLRLAKLPRVYMKFSGIRHSSKQPPPHRDVKPVVRRIFQAFGPERIIWGGLGMNMADFKIQQAVFDEMFDYAAEADRLRIRGANAAGLFGF